MRGDDGQRVAPVAQAPSQALRALGPLKPPRGRARAELVVVVDAHPTMQVWSEWVTEAVAELARQDTWSGVETVDLLGTDETGTGRARLARPLPEPRGRHRLVLVMTDGLATGWLADAVSPLLRAWGRSGPVAVLNPLPQRLWFRTGLDVARVRLQAPRPWAPNSDLRWELRETPLDPPRPEPESGEAAVVVPVLEATDRWLAAWADLVGRPSSGWCELSAMRATEWKRRPDAARAVPWLEDILDPSSAVPAAERVSDFRAASSPTSFALATRLAAAPLTAPVMRSLTATMPGAGPEHLSELLMSGLVRRGPVDDDGDEVAFTFAPGIREELLALGRRSETVRVLHDVRVLLGDDPPSGSDRQPVLPPGSEPLDTLVMPTVSGRNIAFLRIELAALRALSGRFRQRAGMLAGVLNWYDQHHTVDLTKRNGPLSGVSPFRPDRHPPGRGAPESDANNTPKGAAMATLPQPTTEGQRTSQQPRVWGNVPPRNPNFTGRAHLLALLSERLREGTTTVLPEAIHGMGGVGKTQLAIEYAYLHQSEYDIVWWIPAERPGQIGQALVELAQRLGLETSMEANIAGPAVREALREGRPYSRWLLIFDNADDPERVRHYFPTGGNGTILVTSRNRRWDRVGSSLEVDVFIREESKELLTRSGPPLSDEEADRLAAALGDLPLALEQAAAWRAETGMPASEYLRLFESKRTELLEVSPPPDYQLPVAAAWNVSLDHLETRSPAALRLLQLCSYFAPDPIARSIFTGLGNSSIVPELDAVLNDPMRLARAIREISRYSLARIDHRTNSIEMHRLVQLVLNNRMTPEEQRRMRQGAHTLLAAADPKSPVTATNWPRYAELYGHVIASNAIESDQPWVRQLVMNIAEYLYYWGDHDVALDFSEQAWKTWRSVFGDEDQQTRLMGQWLCFMYWVVGRYRDAAHLIGELREIYDRTAPPGGEDTREDALKALNLEAAVRRVEGDFAAGARLDELAYERSRRAFGEDDPDTLNSAHNLGVSLRLIGDFRRALALDERTLEMKTRLFGRDDQRTLITERSFAIDIQETGDYVGARTRQQVVLDGFRNMFGPGNPTTIRAIRELSEACRKEGDHAASLELANEAYALFTRRYGDTHPQSLATALTVSIALRQSGELEAARDRGVKAAQRYRSIFDPHHPHVLSADVDLAVTLRLLGQAEEARRLDETALMLLTERLGASHPIPLACAINLASDLSALGDIDGARELGRRTLELCRSALGEDHPTTLVCAANLALDLTLAGAEAESAALRADTLERMERVLDAPRLNSPSAAPHPATEQMKAGLRANCDIDPMPL
ncbi:NB-ARC domain-containing protein [Actinacidiphila rubida]|uniref:NB-ARC domain-containing protein n=3 Tax=Actinacidiphila rubida TaxID=310780 RepID=A0A1H8EAJ9_9ACTN|nr:FxSxx-COOH system tetratricopeptide repeat protein [Actinacidiphila rubida]SEN16512.1 NB-ARC domain-containing protein [Actinacidiphila rubida]